MKRQGKRGSGEFVEVSWEEALTDIGARIAHESEALTTAPERIKIDPRELAFLPRVAPLLDGNPRALKRFVNTYRLVKASISDVELEYFAGDPHRICMAQLAVLATQRRRARALVRIVDDTSGDLDLAAWLEKLDQQREDASVHSLAADLRASLLPELEHLEFNTFAVWLERTRRYSFYL